MVSLRKFFIAAAIMFVFLVIAIEGLKMMDQTYGLKFLPKPGDVPPSEDGILPTQTTTRVETTRPQLRGPVTAPHANFDAEAMRKAAIIARRGQDLEDAGSYSEAMARYRESLDTWSYQPQIWENSAGFTCARAIT